MLQNRRDFSGFIVPLRHPLPRPDWAPLVIGQRDRLHPTPTTVAAWRRSNHNNACNPASRDSSTKTAEDLHSSTASTKRGASRFSPRGERLSVLWLFIEVDGEHFTGRDDKNLIVDSDTHRAHRPRRNLQTLQVLAGLRAIEQKQMPACSPETVARRAPTIAAPYRIGAGPNLQHLLTAGQVSTSETAAVSTAAPKGQPCRAWRSSVHRAPFDAARRHHHRAVASANAAPASSADALQFSRIRVGFLCPVRPAPRNPTAGSSLVDRIPQPVAAQRIDGQVQVLAGPARCTLNLRSGRWQSVASARTLYSVPSLSVLFSVTTRSAKPQKPSLPRATARSVPAAVGIIARVPDQTLDAVMTGATLARGRWTTAGRESAGRAKNNRPPSTARNLSAFRVWVAVQCLSIWRCEPRHRAAI